MYQHFGLSTFIKVFYFPSCRRQAPGYGDVRLSLEMIPDTVNLEEPFDITCKITNCRYSHTDSSNIIVHQGWGM